MIIIKSVIKRQITAINTRLKVNKYPRIYFEWHANLLYGVCLRFYGHTVIVGNEVFSLWCLLYKTWM